MLRIIMAILWRDLTAHRWHWFILIYFLGSSMRKIWLSSVGSDITECHTSNIYILRRARQGANRQMLFLTDWPCTWFCRCVYQVWADCSSFDFSHVVDILICGNRLWFAFMPLLKTNCGACKEILVLTEQTWMFHTNHFKRVSGIWKSL